MENRSRRNNLRVDGINENEGESWEESELKVKKVFEELIPGKMAQIEPRTIVIKCLDFKDVAI